MLIIPCRGEGIDDIRFSAGLGEAADKSDAINRVATEAAFLIEFLKAH